ncbi:MAG: response regulator [Myxococcales bacterium]|nr:response regulator [Myxococcales bacterium]
MTPPPTDPYRELFERSADAILIIEGEHFVDCNQATVAMLRYQDKAELLRTHPSELSPPTQPDGRSSFEKANEMMAIARERGSHRFEWDHRRVDGEVFPVEVLLTAVERDGKEILHVVWRDITDRRRLEGQLRHSQKMEIIGQLAGGIAHDFNNLLVAIMGNGELLQRKLQDRSDLVGYVDEMVKAGQRGATLVRQLLLFSRHQDMPTALIDLVPILGDVQLMLERLIGENVRLAVESGAASLPIRGTRSQVEQVIVNLVTNARDAMPDGGVVSVVLEAVELAEDSIGAVERLAPGSYARLSVSDSGQGMGEEVLAHAIDPFFTTKAVGRGTGLGLSTVYGIAKQSGGGLRIDSTVGRGTSVRVYLPLLSGVPAIEHTSSSPPRPAVGGSERLVVAEDDETVARVIVRVLEANGYHVQRATDGMTAAELILQQSEESHLLLTDVVMPRMSGPDLVKTLRARNVDIPVLFMSGYSRDALSAMHDQGAGLDVLKKPFTATELVGRVREALDRHARLRKQ